MTEGVGTPLDPARSFADELLPATLHNAARLPFYKELWRGAERDVRSVEDLPALPVVTKAVASELFSTFEYDEAPAVLLHTSGTSGRITARCRSAAEIRALLSVRETSAPRTADGLLPLILAVDCANHGQMIAQSAGEFGLKAIGFDLDVIDHVIQQLDRSYAFPQYTSRICAIHASLGFIKLLTVELLKRGKEPRELGVALLSTFGEYASQRWADWLQTTWNALHVDRYANSETVGGARRCHRCGWFVFDPESWPEIVGLQGHVRAPDMIGLLAVTELYPFSQLQPLIRFLPGDLMEEGQPLCDLRHRRAYRYLGRIDRALVYGEGNARQVLIYPAEFADALDDFPELVRAPIFHRIQLDAWSQDLAAPLAGMAFEEREERSLISVTVCPRFSPLCFPEAADRLKADLRRTLLARCRGLAENLQKELYDFAIQLQYDSSRLRPYTAS